MNEDASTFELPEYIQSRLQPQIFVDFPSYEEEKAILKTNLPWADEGLLEYIVRFLQLAHKYGELYSVRDGVNIGRYILKKLAFLKDSSKNSKNLLQLLKEAISIILGPQALIYFKELIEDKKITKPLLRPLD